LRVPWWFAGGWALDLYAGAQSRPHHDLDVGVLRRDVPAVIAALSNWEFFEAKSGVLTRLGEGAIPRNDVNCLWCRQKGTAAWTLEFLMDESLGDSWVFRRQPAIRRPLSTIIQRSPDGLPYLAAEIQLLYKSRDLRARDRIDFDHIAPRLSPDARAWLRDALERISPGHEWMKALGAPTG
jgi:hypothetical protein